MSLSRVYIQFDQRGRQPFRLTAPDQRRLKLLVREVDVTHGDCQHTRQRVGNLGERLRRGTVDEMNSPRMTIDWLGERDGDDTCDVLRVHVASTCATERAVELAGRFDRAYRP